MWGDPNTDSSMLWVRELRSWELEESMKISDIINEVVLQQGEDHMQWKVSGKAYSSSDGKVFLNSVQEESNNVWKLIWKSKAPPKVQIFMWKFEHKIIPTKELLGSRMGAIISVVTCSFCSEHLEDQNQNHLFWGCKFAREIRSKIFEWWGFSVNIRSISSFCVWEWINWCQKSLAREVWCLTSISTLWTIWLCRNLIVFEQKVTQIEEVVWLVKVRTWKWAFACMMVSEHLRNLWDVNPGGAVLSRLNQSNPSTYYLNESCKGALLLSEGHVIYDLHQLHSVVMFA
ncbi:hypothetical protein POM88_037398 [Heracleum sosnowskyi]|uniref:Reverse transcriptase zinc-binding domain-containing protein n=1 Tax=Heracleum sosnowskyi TaxID=360622 RepID=A0AAD8HR17_9APIA|nr:hypothetical protein POM88_037398 [Heracleum sosnowskyi]